MRERVVKTMLASPFVYASGREVLVESVRDALGCRDESNHPPERRLEELMAWLCRAQDATPDGGVSRAYTVVYNPFFRVRGWEPSYPETTGYIIPTFFDYYYYSGREEFRQRALRMAEWEVDVQLESGAVMGGVVGFKLSPAVFNTGQVIFGWCRAFRETGSERFVDAARRAGDFLVACQDADGGWVKQGSSQYAARGPTVYNTRVSWALLLLHQLTEDPRYRDAAVRNLRWALERQEDSGWFQANCLDDPSRPLVHTIAYAVQGVLESGFLLEDDALVRAAAKAATEMAGLLRADGSLAGRYDRAWRPAATWSCLTGNVQMSIVWSRLHGQGLLPGGREVVGRINAFNNSVHDLRTASLGRRGGVKGSYPIYAEYGTFEYLNWAAKFTVDALLLDLHGGGDPRMAQALDKGAPLFWGT
ncbi:MAG: prenyltransferase/squalene oxidase repeat-containing protein [Deferrisomatales bacterium]